MAGVSTVTGFATNVSSNVLSRLWSEVVEDVKMVVSLPRAVIDMEGEDERLNNVIDRIRVELTREQRIVGTWLDKAEQAMESSRSIRDDYQRHKNCLGCFPNCLSRFRVSKNMRDWKGKVAQLHSERKSDFPSNGEYGDFTKNKLLVTWLTDQEYSNMIHGMGGVGKMSLLDTINDSHELKDMAERLPGGAYVHNRPGSLPTHTRNGVNLQSVNDVGVTAEMRGAESHGFQDTGNSTIPDADSNGIVSPSMVDGPRSGTIAPAECDHGHEHERD